MRLKLGFGRDGAESRVVVGIRVGVGVEVGTLHLYLIPTPTLPNPNSVWKPPTVYKPNFNPNPSKPRL